MGPANGVKETTRVTAPVASNTLSVNVFTAPGKAMVGERPKPFGEAFGFDPITSTLIFGEHDAVLVDAIVQSDPMRESLGLSHRCFLQPIEVLQVTTVARPCPLSRKSWTRNSGDGKQWGQTERSPISMNGNQ